METAWERTAASIKQQVPEHLFRMWIEPLKQGSCKNDSIELTCPNLFSMRRVKEIYGPIIEAEVLKTMGKKCNFVVADVKRIQKEPTISSNSYDTIPDMIDSSNFRANLRKTFTFDRFVVGESNRLAYYASLALASDTCDTQNSLFLISKTGMGKSHIAQAVCHHILSKFPSQRVYYTSAEDFTREMVVAYKKNNIDDFKEKYKKHCDTLVIEDVHHLSGRQRSQVELTMILDSLYKSNKKVFFSSCCPPVDIPKMDDALKSRLSCDLISSIERPDFRTRMRILKKKALLNRWSITDELLSYLASELTENVRQLESGLSSVMRMSSLMNEPVNLKTCENTVKNIVDLNKRITIDVIKHFVAREFKISVKDIVSKSRRHCFVRPRQIAIYLAHNYTDTPVQSIAKSFNRYHATAFHSINTVEKGIKEDHTFKGQVLFLSKKLENGDF